MVPIFASGVTDTSGTSGKFTAYVVDTGGKFATGDIDTDGKFATGVIDIGGVPWLAKYLRECSKNLEKKLFEAFS